MVMMVVVVVVAAAPAADVVSCLLHPENLKTTRQPWKEPIQQRSRNLLNSPQRGYKMYIVSS